MTNNKLKTNVLPIKKLEEVILLSFSFNHNRFSPNFALQGEQIISSLKKGIKEVLTIFNSNCANRIIWNEFQYQESYQRIDFNNRHEPHSFLFEFDESSYLSRIFSGFDLHFYYDEHHDLLSGGISLKWKSNDNSYFNELLDYVYLHNFTKYFMESSLLPIITNSFSHFSFLVEDRTTKKFKLETFLEQTYMAWVELVEQKFSVNKQLLQDKKYFYALINPILIALNFINAIRLVVSYHTNFSFLNFNFNHADKKVENSDFAFFVNFLHHYTSINFLNNTLVNKKSKLHSKQYEFNDLQIIIDKLFYLNKVVFFDEIKELIIKHKKELDKQDEANRIILVLSALLNSEKFMQSVRSKFFISNSEFKEIIYEILDNKDFLLENEKALTTARFYSNSHFVSYINFNTLMLGFVENTTSYASQTALMHQYTIAIIYFGALNAEYKKIETFSKYIILHGTKNKNFSYRRIIKDLRTLVLDFYTNLYGLDSIKYIVANLDKEFHLLKELNNLIKKVRTEDEAEKLVVERNSIATAFICALFIGVIWFIDQCFASLQSTDSGGDAPSPSNPSGSYYPGYSDSTISFPIIYGFVGLATFVIVIITFILAYHCTKLYLIYHRSKNQGVLNVY